MCAIKKRHVVIMLKEGKKKFKSTCVYLNIPNMFPNLKKVKLNQRNFQVWFG